MSIRSFVASLLIIAGCSTAMIVATAMFMSMQLDNGSGLLLGVGALFAAALSLVLGFFILVYRG